MKDRYRGHLIEITKDRWVYSDTHTPVSCNPDRPCGHCGLANTPEGHDGCLGTLPNVMNACCGHGNERQAYIMYDNGNIIRGEKATMKMREAE